MRLDGAADMSKSCLRSSILNLFEGAGHGYGQKCAQKLHFEHFGDLAADMGKSCLRGSILSILGGWLQIWAKVASDAPFLIFEPYGSTDFGIQSQNMLKGSPQGLILATFGPKARQFQN